WLRDYLYIPLGGSRHGTVRTGFALMTTMMLGGLWHGAAWTFLLWGGYQGLLLVVERARGRRALYAAAPPALQVAATFVLVLVGWVIFRASSMAELGRMLRGMVGGYGLGSWPEPELYAWRCYGSLGCGLLVAFTCPQAMALARRFHLLAVVLGAVLFVLALAQLFATGFSPFIYYQF
ncbi:MAG: membrane-bound O-acyltransferase family protein, partial [Planctomycetes bacterium]|nr:membrane-bound O-acyltransferase family protein [Planctomycetota bacterium]